MKNSVLKENIHRAKAVSFAGGRQTSFFKPFIQPKLSINQPKDVYEQEADAKAQSVMRMPAYGDTFFKPVANSIQRKCTHCNEKDKAVQMYKDTNAVAGRSAPSIVNNVMSSKGEPLSASTKKWMESRFGYDFSDVRIHNDSLAHQSSAAINALAYTHGNHVVFRDGQYQPASTAGKQLLAHELTHVIQQSHSAVREIQRSPDTPPDPDPKQDVYEQYVQEGKYCRDTEETGRFHEGQCYREIRSSSGYPSGQQYCFDKKSGEYIESSPDYVSAVTGQLADGSCAPYMGFNPLIYLGTLRGRRALGHAVGDICPDPESIGMCSQIFGSLAGAFVGFGMPKHGLGGFGLGSIFIPAITGSMAGWLLSKGIPAIDGFVRKRGFLPTYTLGAGTELNFSTGIGYEQRGSGLLSPLKTYLTFGLDSTVNLDVLEDAGVGSTVIAKIGLRFDPGPQGGPYALGSAGVGISLKDDISEITSTELGIGYRFTDFLDVQLVRVQNSGNNHADFFLKLYLVAPKRVLEPFKNVYKKK